MPTTRTLAILDDLAAEGVEVFASAELRARLGVSPQATSNLLRQLTHAGLVDRAARGHYALRPLGRLGTSAAAEDVALAVGALVAGEPHRLAYRSALDYNDLLTHPARTIQVAAPRRIQVRRLSARRLQIVHEHLDTVRLGAEPVAAGAWVSGHARALLDAAARPDLAGGAATLAEALHARPADPAQLHELAGELHANAALRRLGSLADTLEIHWLASTLERPGPGGDIWLEPHAKRHRAWRDSKWGVIYSQPPQELASHFDDVINKIHTRTRVRHPVPQIDLASL